MAVSKHTGFFIQARACFFKVFTGTLALAAMVYFAGVMLDNAEQIGAMIVSLRETVLPKVLAVLSLHHTSFWFPATGAIISAALFLTLECATDRKPRKNPLHADLATDGGNCENHTSLLIAALKLTLYILFFAFYGALPDLDQSPDAADNFAHRVLVTALLFCAFVGMAIGGAVVTALNLGLVELSTEDIEQDKVSGQT